MNHSHPRSAWAWRRHLPTHLLRYQLLLPPNPVIAVNVGALGLMTTLGCTAEEAAAIVQCAQWDIDHHAKARRPAAFTETAAALQPSTHQ